MATGKRGPGRETRALLTHVVEVVATRQPIGVRGIAYQLFVKKIIPAVVQRETQRISRLTTYAREQCLIPWEHIVDETRQLERPPTWRNPRVLMNACVASYRKDYWLTQPVNVQVWSEKATVGGILRPVTEALGVPFMAVHGFGSTTAVHDAAAASAGDPRPTVVLYTGDHDPSGMMMSEVDLPERLARYGGNATIRRIALISTDLPTLPSFKAKPSDPRFQWYRARYGELAWELDAMDPNLLRARVKAAIEEYINWEAWGRMRLAEAAEQTTLAQVARAMAG
jgi:hypothetical protein